MAALLVGKISALLFLVTAVVDANGKTDCDKAMEVLRGLDAEYPDLHHFGYGNVRTMLPAGHKFDFRDDREHSVWAASQAGARSTGQRIFAMVGNIASTLYYDYAQPPYSSVAVNKYVAHVNSAIGLLEKAWYDHLDSEAGQVLADMAFYGNYSTPIRMQTAQSIFARLAAEFGSAHAHYHLGLIYAANLGNVHQSNSTFGSSPAAHIHFAFAASANITGAEMALAYRYHEGIGTSKSCALSASYYSRVARKVLSEYHNGPPWGRSVPPAAVRLYFDEESGGAGGLYGPGGQAKTGGGVGNVQHASESSEHALSQEDTYEYYKYLADSGELQAQYILGVSFYWGTRTLPRHYGRAMRYLSMAANRAIKVGDAEHNRFMSHAAAIIGRMYLRGEGVPTSNATAQQWLEKASKAGDMLALTYLSIMVMDRASSHEDIEKPSAKQVELALTAIKLAAKEGRIEAHAFLGQHFFYSGSAGEALRHLSHAATHGDLVSMALLAEMYYYGIGVDASCSFANQMYRGVAEKGMAWVDDTMEEAYDEVVTNPELGMLLYLKAAEAGSEIAQSNLAWLLAKHAPFFNELPAHWAGPSSGDALLPLAAPHETRALVEDIFPRATELIMWNRAGMQSNGYARVRAADAFYYGSAFVARDYERAVILYRKAADAEMTPIAMWNVGYMYHHGLGVPADRYLAKRYYDLALETNKEAWLPVMLSLWHLKLQSFWSSDEQMDAPTPVETKKEPETDSWTWKDVQKHARGDKAPSTARRPSFVQKVMQHVLGEEAKNSEAYVIAALCVVAGYLLYLRRARVDINRVPA